MYTKKVGIKLLIVTIVAICGLVLTTGIVSAADIFVGPGETYTTIQSAVAIANPFDTIIVRDGIYTENADVDVDNLTIRSENGSENCVVQANNPNKSVFTVISNNNVTIKGFTIKGGTGHHWEETQLYGYSGLKLYNANHCKIIDNNVSNNTWGVFLENSSNSLVMNNTISKNIGRGIILNNDSSDNIIINNTANLNQLDGISLKSSNNNTLTGNTANSNKRNGILLFSSSNNSILTDNTADSNDNVGILFNESSYNQLTNNTISNNGKNGICFRRSSYNTLKSNRMSNNFFFNFVIRDTVTLEEWNNTIDDSNTANGLPIYYFYKKHDLVIDNYATYKIGIIGCTNVILRNITFSGGDPIAIVFTNDSLIENCIITNNNAAGFVLLSSHYNHLTNNTASQNLIGFSSEGSTHNSIRGNIVTENVEYGIEFSNCSNNLIYNNYFDNTNNAQDDGNNIWNISNDTLGTNIIGGPCLGGNYWSDYSGEDLDGDGIGDTKLPYNSSGGIQNGGDWLPLVKPSVFDTDAGTYPSISGTHNGTIIPLRNITISRLYTYPCEGTGGHTESIELYKDDTLIASGVWEGYQSDWQTISFDSTITLEAGKTYYYTIRTGSYPQIVHAESKDVEGGTITCNEFTDVNGKTYGNRIPAIRLE